MKDGQLTNLDLLYLTAFPDYDLLWTDPPWGQRMVKFFETLIAKAGGSPPHNKIEVLLAHLAHLTARDKPAFIEFSQKEYTLVTGAMTAAGHTLAEVKTCLQANGAPFVVCSFNTDFRIPDGLQGFEIITTSLLRLRPRIVYDPMAGLGKTAAAVQRAGAEYWGNEINPARYRKLQQVVR